MKSSPLGRRSSLHRKSPLRSRTRSRTRRKSMPIEPGRESFKLVRDGICRACGAHGMVRRHHVVLEQRVRREGGDPWDLDNSMWVGLEGITCRCHRRHHDAFEKIPMERVPDHAVAWAVDLLGEHGAAAYFAARYAA